MPSTTPTPNVEEPLTISVRKFLKLSGLSNTKTYELIKEGALQTVTVGRKRLVIYASAKRLLTPAGGGDDA